MGYNFDVKEIPYVEIEALMDLEEFGIKHSDKFRAFGLEKNDTGNRLYLFYHTNGTIGLVKAPIEYFVIRRYLDEFGNDTSLD